MTERVSDERLGQLIEAAYRPGEPDDFIGALRDLIDARAELRRVEAERDDARGERDSYMRSYHELHAAKTAPRAPAGDGSAT